MSDFYPQLAQGYRLEPGRLDRAREIVHNGWVRIVAQTPHQVEAQVSGHYRVAIDLVQGVQAGCTCPDFVRGQHRSRACKHIIALALVADNVLLPANGSPIPAPEETQAEETVPKPTAAETSEVAFRRQVRQAIGQAIQVLADRVEATLQAGEIPFLIGPTGAGKTSAVRLVATRNGWGFEEVAGAPSFADGDLLGIRTGLMEEPGVFARAFQRARNGERVLLFLDEVTRLNTRAQDILMRPFQAAPVAVAQAMGLTVSEPVRLVEAPLWGLEWAPVSRVHLVLAANPWGHALDPALIRRVWPLVVALDDSVAGLFDPPLADAIRASWRAVANGELPLPIEYQALASAHGPGDASLLTAYLLRLGTVDRAAADGFRTVLQGIGLPI